MGSIGVESNFHHAIREQLTTKQPWRETPLIESTNLSKAAGCRIFLKLELHQPAGSFKSRGLGLLVARHQALHASDPASTHFYSSSGGNAGLACVHAARDIGRPSTVVVPTSTPEHMRAKIRAAGASQVLAHGASWREADRWLREEVMVEAGKKGEEAVYVPPFDHPDVWEGNSTLVSEVDEQLRVMGESPPEVVVCSCGGGGLFNGITMGIRRLGRDWERTKIVVVNTVGADALPKSLEAGELVTIPAITSIAKSLGATRVSEKTFELAKEGTENGTVRSVVLTDAEAAMGSWRFADDERMLVEPACGVNLALCYGDRLKKALGRSVKAEEKVVIVVCGGQNVSTEIVEGWRKEYGDLDDGFFKDVPSSTTAPAA